jgi:nicotinic acid mononucleotide adenylyltransferase
MDQDREPRIVPFGYEQPQASTKGTLIYYDTFEGITDGELELAASYAEQRAFAKLVLYPLHEQTVKRMTKDPVGPYHKREDRLHAWRRGQHRSNVAIEGWEGKRKKYTPTDSALRHLTEKYAAPHFLLLSPEMAQLLASFSSFEEWIVKLRLLLLDEPRELHPRLAQYRHRWSTVNESSSVTSSEE